MLKPKLYEVTVTVFTYASNEKEAENQVSSHLDTGDFIYEFEIQGTNLKEEIDVPFERMKAESLMHDLGFEPESPTLKSY